MGRAHLASVALLALVAACSTAPATTGVGGPPRPGGTLRVGLDFSPTCLDPQQAGQTPDLGVIESLTAQDPRTGTIQPGLAASWTSDAESKQFTFHLRAGVTFSDGKALDAGVVVANFHAFAGFGAKASGGGAALTGLTEVTAPDANTVTVRFDHPNAQFLQATSTQALGVLSPSSLAIDPARRCAGEIVGTGPFVLRSYQPRRQIVLARRPGYAAPAPARQGDAYLDRVEIQIIPEAATRTGSLSSGQLDLATGIAPTDEPLFTSGDFTLQDRINPGLVLSLLVNERRPVLADVAVRRALQRAIDRGSLVSALLSPRYKPASSVLSSTTPGHTDLAAQLRYDPDGARAALDAAGWRPGPDGIRVKDGRRLAVDVIFGRPQGLELIQQQLHAVGVDLRLHQQQISELQSQLSAGNYDLFLGDSDRADPDVLRGGLVQTGLAANPALSKALDTEAATLDPAGRAAAVAEVQRTLVDNADVLPLNEQARVVATAGRVHGLAFTATSDIALHDVWLG